MLIFLIPFALVYTYGKFIGAMRQAVVIGAVMVVLIVITTAVAVGVRVARERRSSIASTSTRPHRRRSPAATSRARRSASARRISAIWGSRRPHTSNGSVNSMHDSYTPLGGMMPLVNMKLGEVSPGGVGVGLNGILILVLTSVFIAGLMVGRTPEYLGKKIMAAT